MKQLYGYSGPVMIFGRCVSDKWEGETYASSEAKAKNNLSYAFKLRNNLSPNAHVSLPGKLTPGGIAK